MTDHTCYFCQGQISPVDFCWRCSNDNDLSSVFTIYEDGYPIVAHIYLKPTPRHQWHVCLWITGNYTEIENVGVGSVELLRFAGLPLTPANVKDKLKLYLLFS
jgi:hypothetical protein